MTTDTKRFYNFGGMNTDVNPLLMKDSELNMALNFYTHRYGAKKVRFGYTQLYDNPDNAVVAQLIYYNMPNGNKGILRVSGGKIYKNTFSNTTWGSSIKTLSQNSLQGSALLAGSVPYLHLSNPVDGYYTWNGSAFASWAGGYTPKSTYLASWNSRIFADVNLLSLAQSAISFDLNAGYTTDPFTINNNDPAGGGTVTISAGKDGKVVGMTSTGDRVNIYKQTGVIRYNGQSFFRLPYFGGIFSGTVTPTKYDTDYFLATNGIYRNVGTSVDYASFGINNSLLDTLRVWGITNPVGFSFDDLTIFFIGTIRIGTGDQALDIPNACFVHHERYDEWYIWSLAHQMTAFGYAVDPTSNQAYMISGDANGNTYAWGEQYTSDNGTPIDYRLRTKYFDFGAPEADKIGHRWSATTGVGSGALLQMATNYSDQYVDVKTLQGFGTKGFFPDQVLNFKTVSIQIQGATKTDRPEFMGISLTYKDAEDRYEEKNAARK